MSDKVWIYQAADFLNPQLCEQIEKEAAIFLENWQYHGKKVQGSLTIRKGIFLILQAESAISGCGIDQSKRFILELEKKIGISLTDRMQVAFEKEGKVQKTHLQEIGTLFEKGIIDLQTTFFDNLVQSIEQFEKSWRLPLAESWHRRFL